MTYQAPVTHHRGAFRVIVTSQGRRSYRASVFIGGGARSMVNDLAAISARVAEVWDAATPADALAAADECAREMAAAGEYAAWGWES